MKSKIRKDNLMISIVLIQGPEANLIELRKYHKDEHKGPCTVRNHDYDNLVYSLKKIGMVLIEDEK